jgi:hypothetical protein
LPVERLEWRHFGRWKVLRADLVWSCRRPSATVIVAQPSWSTKQWRGAPFSVKESTPPRLWCPGRRG